jgi:hypothetical protein
MLDGDAARESKTITHKYYKYRILRNVLACRCGAATKYVQAQFPGFFSSTVKAGLVGYLRLSFDVHKLKYINVYTPWESKWDRSCLKSESEAVSI